MFDTLTERLDGVFSKLRKRGKLHPKQVDNALADVRTALLEADVAVEVADDLLEPRPLSCAVGRGLEEPHARPTGREGHERRADGDARRRAPAVHPVPAHRRSSVLLAGVQGSGKTTASAKLAKHLKSKGRRPAAGGRGPRPPGRASNSSGRLGREIGVPSGPRDATPSSSPRTACKEAERTGADVVIVDTAGRLHVDPEMMKQARKIKDVTKPASRVDGVRRDDGPGCGDPGAGVHA